MNSPEKDYTHRTWQAAAALIAVLVAVSFIPPQSIGGLRLRRANILSDLISFDDAAAPGQEASPELYDEEEFRVDLEEVASRIEADTLQREVPTLYEWRLPADSTAAAPYTLREADTLRRVAVLTPIEDYSDSGRLRAFCDTLLLARRPVRIAFLGDSFVEGDILTADLRECLQTAYGGRPGGGTGFAPMASPLTAFRRTVKTQSKGWTTYNIMQRKSAPEFLRNHFYISGWVSQPSADASTRWENTDFRRQLDAVTDARILFLSPHDSRVEVTLNDTLRHEFAVAGDAAVRQIAVAAPQIHSLAFRVLSGTENFIGYGAIFEGRGVVVDNYSVRSNNGQAMFWTNPSVNARIHSFAPYDLVILQYGLNIMQAGVTGYRSYAAQIEKMVAYVRQCFPGAAVLILGVSDRSVKTDSGFEPMDAVPYMTESQRTAARNTGAAFWPTSEAMRAQGGMAEFVRNGWAGKDYTHINYAGGRRVAWALYDALNEEIRRAREEIRLTERRKAEATAVMDSLQRIRLQRELLPELMPEPQKPQEPHTPELQQYPAPGLQEFPAPESSNLPQQ